MQPLLHRKRNEYYTSSVCICGFRYPACNTHVPCLYPAPLCNIFPLLDDWLTVLHRSITFVDLQLDAQNSYLFTYNTFIKILYMFRALPCSSSEVYVVVVYMQPLVSSLSAGDCLVHRLRKNFFLNPCTGQSPADSDDTRGCIYTITT